MSDEKSNWMVEFVKQTFSFLRDSVNEFTDVMKETIKPRTIFALMFYGTFCYLVLQEKPVPESLNNIVFSLISFWFGTKVGEKWGEINGKETNAENNPKSST
jgi:hypothetical protein